ncbi:MAG: hypothetical protein K0R66_212 [Gammaproteobacteria bacterium]|nr:hypothetical protein [Gammaproteobacteria bacterium]
MDLNIPSSDEIKARREKAFRDIQSIVDNFLQVSQDNTFIKEFEKHLGNGNYPAAAYMLSVGRIALAEPHKIGFRFMSSLNKMSTIRGYAINKKLPVYGDEFREYAQIRLIECLIILSNNSRFTLNPEIHKQLNKIQKASKAIGLDKLAKQQYIQIQLKQIPSLFGRIKKALSFVVAHILKGIRSVLGFFSKAVVPAQPAEQALPQAEKQARMPEPARLESSIKPAISKQAGCPRQVANGTTVHSGSYSTATSLKSANEQAKQRKSAVVPSVK